MKKIFATLAGILVAFSCVAEGWATLGGKNNIGDVFLIYPAWDSWEVASGNVSYNPKTDSNLFYVDVQNEKGNSENPIRYNDLRCEFKANKTYEPIEFSCEKRGSSPLAGATYKIEPNKNPKDCSYRYLFTCTSGCGNPATPLKMTQGYWECSEE